MYPISFNFIIYHISTALSEPSFRTGWAMMSHWTVCRYFKHLSRFVQAMWIVNTCQQHPFAEKSFSHDSFWGLKLQKTSRLKQPPVFLTVCTLKRQSRTRLNQMQPASASQSLSCSRVSRIICLWCQTRPLQWTWVQSLQKLCDNCGVETPAPQGNVGVSRKVIC